MSKIKAGYRITVVSWENDGDNYNTVSMNGLTKEEVGFYKEICGLLKSSHRGGLYGNMYDPSQSKRQKFEEVTSKLIDKYDLRHKIETQDHLMEELCDLGLSCGEYYTRVCEKLTIEFVPQTIDIEDVTNQF